MLTVSITVVLSVLVPYVLLIYFGGRDERRVKKTFRAVEKSNGLNFSLWEAWDLSAIGLDPISRKLIFVQVIEKELKVKLIDLSFLREVKMECVWKGSGKKKNENLEELKLMILMHKGDDEELKFFDRNNDYFENFEIFRGQKWTDEINKLGIMKKLKKVA